MNFDEIPIKSGNGFGNSKDPFNNSKNPFGNANPFENANPFGTAPSGPELDLTKIPLAKKLTHPKWQAK